MKIALDFKKEVRDEIFKDLVKRGFNATNDSSFETIWVYGLSHIDYSKGRIELNENGSMKFYVILLDDLDYFEIHK